MRFSFAMGAKKRRKLTISLYQVGGPKVKKGIEKEIAMTKDSAPMIHGDKAKLPCPVCRGSGRDGPHGKRKKCRTCDGKGYIVAAKPDGQ
jgi:DnaJ-class molecular chaperone